MSNVCQFPPPPPPPKKKTKQDDSPLWVAAENCTTHPLPRVQKLITHPLSAPAHLTSNTFWPVPNCVSKRISLRQPRSQGLSSLPPLVVGRKTLVAAGHMTTQNLGGKKNLLGGRGGRAFCLVDVTNCTLWASNQPLAVAKYYSLFRGSKSNLPMMNATWFLPSSKYRRLSFTRKFGSRMEQKRFDG